MTDLAALTFQIELHGPFRIATGYARSGLDMAADLDQPLPATALKGLARHHAQHLLSLPGALVDATFGAAATPSPWRWDDADFQQLEAARRAQTAIDPNSGRPVDGSLRIGEELWCPPGTKGQFRITQANRLANTDLSDQIVVLIAATCSVHSIGSDRRRGLGWCTVSLDDVSGVPAELGGAAELISTVANRCTTLARRVGAAPIGQGPS
jgi:hypothetical protein